ncbi:hypothetical protein Hdeb2414_s0021g00568991 [Helianthus debilis subsp. tardiflorus]
MTYSKYNCLKIRNLKYWSIYFLQIHWFGVKFSSLCQVRLANPQTRPLCCN